MDFKNHDLEQCTNYKRTDLEVFVQERISYSLRERGFLRYKLFWSFNPEKTHLSSSVSCFFNNRMIGVNSVPVLDILNIESFDSKTKETILLLHKNTFCCEKEQTSEFIMALWYMSDLFRG